MQNLFWFLHEQWKFIYSLYNKPKSKDPFKYSFKEQINNSCPKWLNFLTSICKTGSQPLVCFTTLNKDISELNRASISSSIFIGFITGSILIDFCLNWSPATQNKRMSEIKHTRRRVNEHNEDDFLFLF